MADALLSPDDIALLENHPMGRALNQDFRIAALDPEVSGLARPVLVATRYIDQHLRQAAGDGFQQFVFLNGGFDTRSYRFRQLFTDSKVIEINSPATERLKRERVEAVLGPPPEYLTYADASIDLKDIANPNEKTAFVWESASMHTAETRVREMLASVARFAKGSLLLMDYAPLAQVEKVNRDPMSPQSRWDRMWGEPWVFGPSDRSFFTSLGLVVSDPLDTNSAEAARRYLTRRDGSIFGPPPNAPGTGFEDDHRRILARFEV
jgi:methyltransferase (TIGR00027 family)